MPYNRNINRREVIFMTSAAQAVKNQEILKGEYSEKAAMGALYDELTKGIDGMKKGDVSRFGEP